MHILVRHKISDSAAFWPILEDALVNPPSGLKFSCSLPSSDGRQAICLWRADSLDAVKDYVESKVGHISANEYFQVDAEKAVCLPQ